MNKNKCKIKSSHLYDLCEAAFYLVVIEINSQILRARHHLPEKKDLLYMLYQNLPEVSLYQAIL